MADDLGIGDLSIYGNESILTPNIDSIGSNGVTFTHSLATASVCTPSRAALLTSRYPIRYGMVPSFTNRVLLFIAQRGGLPQSEITFAKHLQNQGYATGLLGKWHLGNDQETRGDGLHHPNKHGFNYFFGTPLTNLKDFNGKESVVLSNYPKFYYFITANALVGLFTFWQIYKFGWRKVAFVILAITFIASPGLLAIQKSITIINSVLMENQTVIQQPIEMNGLTKKLTIKADEFVSNAVSEGKPFLLMINFLKVHSAHFPSKNFRGKSSHGPFGDCLLELDWAVGEVLETLAKYNLTKNTMIYFTSDNGGHIEDVDFAGRPSGGFNGPFRGGKGQGAMEGGIRVPLLMTWPSVVEPGTIIRNPVSLMDLLPTILHALDIELPSNLDGKSLLPLVSRVNQSQVPNSFHLHHQILLHYCGQYLHGATYTLGEGQVYKVYFFTPKFVDEDNYKCSYVCQCFGSHVVQHDPPMMYNIAIDQSERMKLDVTSGTYSHILGDILQLVKQHKSTLEENVESQFSLINSIWRPHLQPCCSSITSFCRC